MPGPVAVAVAVATGRGSSEPWAAAIGVESHSRPHRTSAGSERLDTAVGPLEQELGPMKEQGEGRH